MARPFIGIARRGTKCRSKTTLSEPFACPFLAHVAPTALSEVSFGCLINYWAIVDWWPVAQRRRPPRVSLPSSVSIDDISDMLVRGEGEGGRQKDGRRKGRREKEGERDTGMECNIAWRRRRLCGIRKSLLLLPLSAGDGERIWAKGWRARTHERVLPCHADATPWRRRACPFKVG